LKLEWFDKDIVDKVAKISGEVAKQGADMVLSDAKRLVKKKSGALSNQIKVYKNTYKDKEKVGYRVQAQAPGDYDKFYAIFLELGTYKTKAQPYMRPALKRNKSKIKKAMQDKLK